jgi:hypothetical protein
MKKYINRRFFFRFESTEDLLRLLGNTIPEMFDNKSEFIYSEMRLNEPDYMRIAYKENTWFSC